MCDQQSLRSACAYAQSDQSLCMSLELSMSVKLLTEHHLEFLSLRGGCTGSSEYTLFKIPNCWKSHVTAQYYHIFLGLGSYEDDKGLQKRRYEEERDETTLYKAIIMTYVVVDQSQVKQRHWTLDDLKHEH